MARDVADNDIGPVLVELSLGDPSGGIEVFADDDTRQAPAKLYRLDVLGTRAFLPLAFREGHLLAFPQFLESDALDGR